LGAWKLLREEVKYCLKFRQKFRQNSVKISWVHQNRNTSRGRKWTFLITNGEMLRLKWTLSWMKFSWIFVWVNSLWIIVHVKSRQKCQTDYSPLPPAIPLRNYETVLNAWNVKFWGDCQIFWLTSIWDV